MQAVIRNHTLTKKRAFSPLFVTVDFKKCVVSIHVKAAGNGTKWLNATDWSDVPVQGIPNLVNWLNVCVSRLSRTFLVAGSELICQMEIVIGRKISIFFVSLGVRLCC